MLTLSHRRQVPLVKRILISMVAAVVAAHPSDSVPVAPGNNNAAASPIFGVTIPRGYRQWELVSVAHEAGFEELRGILGNPTAIKAYRAGTLPFPDGAILAKLAWKHVPSTEFGASLRPWGRHDGSIHGQGFETLRFHGRLGIRDDLLMANRPDEAQHRTCFACHEAT